MRALLDAAAATQDQQTGARPAISHAAGRPPRATGLGGGPNLSLPLTPEEHTGGVCRNLTDVAASFCALPSETLLRLADDEIDHIRQALTGALVVLRLAEGVRRA